MCGDNDNSFEFFVNWIAHSLFNVKHKTEKCIILKGKQGCGKSVLYNILEKMIGRKYTYSTSRCNLDFFGQFNWCLYKKLFVNINEAEYSCFQSNMEQFKGLITDPSIVLEEKGKNKIRVSNYLNFLITTNNDRIFPISSGDRRWFLMKCSDKFCGKTSYFNELHQYIDNQDIMCQLYNYFVELYKSNPSYDFIKKGNEYKTDYQKMLEVSDIKPLYQFLQQITIENDDNNILEFEPKEILQQISNYCRENKLINTETAKSMKISIQQLYPGCYSRNSKGKWCYKFNNVDLINNLQLSGFWEYE